MCSKCSAECCPMANPALASTAYLTGSPRLSAKPANSAPPESGQRLAGNVGKQETDNSNRRLPVCRSHYWNRQGSFLCNFIQNPRGILIRLKSRTGASNMTRKKTKALYAVLMLGLFGCVLMVFILAAGEQSILSSGLPAEDKMSLQEFTA